MYRCRERSDILVGRYLQLCLFVFFFSPLRSLGLRLHWPGLDKVVAGFRVASKIDAVLLSHPDTLHLGALPYAMKQLGLSAPVYATEPVFRLGLLTMYDQYLSRKVSH